MKQAMKSLPALVLTTAIALSTALPALAVEDVDWQAAATATATYLGETVTQPQFGSTGGEWSVIGLARSGVSVEQGWYDTYLQSLTDTVQELDGVLSTRKYTEYARVVLALTALGQDPRDVAGYDLLAPLGDFDQVVRQGLNGGIFALIALDSGNYQVPTPPTNAIQATREGYVQYILDAQLEDGGWALAGKVANPDVTALALQALAPYRKDYPGEIQSGVVCLALMMKQGNFYNLENYAQTIITLCALGMHPGESEVEEFFSYQLPDGSFRHLKDGGSDLMATEQAMCAMAAMVRQKANASPLYQMEDVQPTAQIDQDDQDGGHGQLPIPLVFLPPVWAALVQTSAVLTAPVLPLAQRVAGHE